MAEARRSASLTRQHRGRGVCRHGEAGRRELGADVGRGDADVLRGGELGEVGE
jgi:hypothetical protein